MGTNVYATIKNIYTDEVLDQYSKLAMSHDIEGLRRLNEEMNRLDSSNCIHIGKRSSGWKFLFNHNDWKYYDFTRESIDKFLRSCYEIKNEYDEILTVDRFWKEYVDDFSDGITGREYWRRELDKVHSKINPKSTDLYDSLLDLSATKRNYTTAKYNNWYEVTEMDGVRIPNDLPYRFSLYTDFC